MPVDDDLKLKFKNVLKIIKNLLRNIAEPSFMVAKFFALTVDNVKKIQH